MNLLRKEKKDTANYREILQVLNYERTKEFRNNRAAILKLYQSDTDISEYMDSNPNDRIQLAVESGLFPES